MSTKNDINDNIRNYQLINDNSNKKSINVYLDIDYNTYKKKIKVFIFEHLQLIYNIFTDDFNENLVKLYILFKKKLLEDYHLKYINLLIDFCQYINKTEYIDQEEYFNIIIKLINIRIFINKLEKPKSEKDDDKSIDFNKVQLIGDKYIKLINFEIINDKIFECLNLISKENVIVEMFLVFVNKQNRHSKRNIIFIGEKLSFDFFMYWSPDELYKKITTNINSTDSKLLSSVKKYKNDFIKSYEHKTNILKKLYQDEINTKLVLKYKLLKNNELFNDLMKDLESINKQFNNVQL